MSLSNYGDVHLFHRKMDLLHPKIPQLLSTELMVQREEFIQEELEELMVAFYGDNLAAVADALIDLVYVVMGTAVMMGLPWQALWDAVQYANIRKERDPSRDTEHHKGVIKPKGWEPPNLKAILDRYTDLALTLPKADVAMEVEFKPEILSAIVNDQCLICGQPYDKHDGTEEHRFR